MISFFSYLFQIILILIGSNACADDLSNSTSDKLPGQFQQREKKIAHPAAKIDGLTRIDSEGNYIYDVQDPLRNESVHLRIGVATNPDISVKISQYNSTNVYEVEFDDIYKGASKLSIGFDYEYYFTLIGGKIGLQTGFATQFADGRGRLASNPAAESIEKFTFITMPIYLGLIYRFEYRDRQYLAPYISGGGSYVGLLEKRDDVDKINAIGTPGFYGAAGLLLNITAFDRDLAGEFKVEYNISNLWINVELRSVQVSSEAFSYNNNFIQGGLSFDF